MKASDLVTTSEQKVLAGERLLFTEQTDAVNTGLVNSADKSGSVLKDRQLPTGGPSSTGRRPPMADGPQPPRGRRDPAGGWRTISDVQAKNPNAPDASLTAQTHRHMAAAMGKRTAATAAGAVVHNTLQDTELDGADNLYYETKGTVSGAKAVYANADETGKAIVNAALVTPWPGADLCATWVSHVYQQAGLGYPTGNGNSILAGYATSSDWANIKVGQIISAQYGSGSAGAIYGHTGIYIGDGKVMDSISSGIRTSSLTDWIAENGRGWVVYGWPW